VGGKEGEGRLVHEEESFVALGVSAEVAQKRERTRTFPASLLLKGRRGAAGDTFPDGSGNYEKGGKPIPANPEKVESWTRIHTGDEEKSRGT